MKPATLVTTADFLALEAELLARIDAVKEGRPFASVLVVAPSDRMLWRIRRALLERNRACLGLRLLNHRQLAAETVRGAGGDPPQVAEPSLLAAALGEAIGGLVRPGPVARYARQYPGALSSLTDTFDRLREAGVEAAAARRVLKNDETVSLYALYEKTLAALERKHNLTDAAGLAWRAVEAAPGSLFLAGAAALLHYGAYDLVQAQADLLAAAGARVPLHLLVPGLIEGPAGDYARRFLGSPLCRSAARRPAHAAASGWLSGRESALYGQDDAPSPGSLADANAPLVVTAVGARAELVFAARQALAFHRDGVPLSRIGVVARTLDPYGPLVETVFSGFGLPVATSWSRPLASEAPVRAFLRLAEALSDGLPRAPFLEALAAGARPTEEEPFPAPLLSRWERSARAARIVGGEADWTRRLPDWAAREEAEHRASFDLVRDVRRLAKLTERLSAEAAGWGGCRTWSDHAAFLSGLVDRWIPLSGAEPDDAARKALRKRIDDLAALDDAAPRKGRPRVEPADAAALLAGAVDAASAPAPPPDRDGVAVLDVMQARGLVFDRLILLGLASDQWPRKPRPDPFLDDAARHALSEALGVRLPVEADAREEERLLLALTLAASQATPILVVPRADDSGRARAPATLLREVARVVTGVPEAERLLAKAVPIPTDPARAARAEAKRTGIATAVEMILAAADAPDGARRAAEAARETGADSPFFLRGLAHAEAVGRWDPGDLAYDGRIPPPDPRPFTASRVETLGECPLKYFFRHVLDLPESGSDPELLLPPDEVGSGTHDALAWLYGRLAAEKAFPVSDLAKARRLAERFLPEAFAQNLEARLSGLAGRLPLFWAVYRKRWIASVASFVRWDLARLAATQAIPRFFEEKERAREAEIPTLDGTRRLPLKGRIDRIDEGPDGEITVFDYKTGRSNDGLVNLSELLKGKDMQLPLYHFLARAVFPNRRILPPWILGVGPAHVYAEGKEGESAACLEEIAEPEIQAALGHSLAALADLAANGLFPMAPSRGCAWCPYEAACRRSHPPSVRRVETAPEFALFRNLRARSAANPSGKGR